MKKFLAGLAVVGVSLAFVACGKNSGGSSSNSPSAPAVATTPSGSCPSGQVCTMEGCLPTNSTCGSQGVDCSNRCVPQATYPNPMCNGTPAITYNGSQCMMTGSYGYNTGVYPYNSGVYPYNTGVAPYSYTSGYIPPTYIPPMVYPAPSVGVGFGFSVWP